jgi:hypothetical protein
MLGKTVAEFMEVGGNIEEVNKGDQSRFSYLENHDQLKDRNVQKIYTISRPFTLVQDLTMPEPQYLLKFRLKAAPIFH